MYIYIHILYDILYVYHYITIYILYMCLCVLCVKGFRTMLGRGSWWNSQGTALHCSLLRGLRGVNVLSATVQPLV